MRGVEDGNVSEANIVRPELPEEADRVEQLLVEFRAVQQRIHDLNQVTPWLLC